MAARRVALTRVARAGGVPAAGRELIGSGLVLALAVGVANALNAVFQFALARILERDEYSLLAALFAVVLIGAVPPLAFQATTARAVAARLADGERAEAAELLRATLRSVLGWTAALLALAAVLVPIGAALGLRHPLAIGATAATVAIALCIPVVWGGLQGAGRFRDLSAATLLFAGTRLAAGLAAGVAGGGVGAVMLGVAAATAATALASLVPLRGLLACARGRALPRHRLATLPNAAAATGLTTLTALASSDLLVAKLSFAGGRAGDYAAASVGARVLLLIPIAVTTVLFPRVATLRDPGRERRHLLAGLGAVALASAAATALLWTLAKPLIDLTFGAKYDDAAPWLGPLSVAMALYALATVYLYHFLSLGRSRFAIWLVAVLAAQLALFAALHGSPSQLIGVQLGVSAATLAAAEAWHARRHR
ncbi:MAG TPA: oligosaccharide flippase family protein [Gaiellaceae bacterium]|nr:oligosaccharide flippase family protein [Gaiellaceae bacterium]